MICSPCNPRPPEGMETIMRGVQTHVGEEVRQGGGEHRGSKEMG